MRRYRDDSAFREGAGGLYRGHTLVTDYPSPNVAKQMHVGHLRPMVVGEAVARLLAFCGADLVRDNHIGDWGTNFGVLILALKESGENLVADPEAALAQLERLYKAGSAKAVDKNSPWADAARAELVKLQNGEPENTRIWEQIVAVSNRAAEVVYKMLGVTIEHTLGESFYRDKVEHIYAELNKCGLAGNQRWRARRVPSRASALQGTAVYHPQERWREQLRLDRSGHGALPRRTMAGRRNYLLHRRPPARPL